MIRITTENRVQAAGPEWDALFQAGPGAQSLRGWFAAIEQAALPPGTLPTYVLLHDEAGALACLPMLAGPGRRLGSLTTPYTCLYQPLVRPGLDVGQLAAIGAAFGRWCRPFPVVRLDALDPAWPGLGPFLAGCADAGLAVRRFQHFGNWFLDVGGVGWAAYLAGRPGTLRETVRRKTRAAARDSTVTIKLVRGREGLDEALAAYEDVYARSWKQPEPFPRFNACLLPLLADAGVLMIGVLRAGGIPVAAQYWTVSHGTATVLKLAHDDSRRSLSPGTVLTAHIIQTLLEQDCPQKLDFGRGDDPYKHGWTGQRRPRIGALLAWPTRPAGLAAILRHDAGAALRRLRRR